MQWRDIEKQELEAFFGLRILFRISKGNHESVRDSWGDGH